MQANPDPPTLEVRDSVAPKSRVLLADDDVIVRRGIKRLLEAKGYEVVTAEHGLEATALLENQEFDAVISDIAMPKLDGIQLLSAMHRSRLTVPVVLITGEPSLPTAIAALECGAFRYLTKPVDMERLEEVVRKATARGRAARQHRLDHSVDPFAFEPPSENLVSLERKFHRALDSLWIAYQPIVWAATNEVFGYEALLRSEELALPHPGAVLDAAERLQRLETLGRQIRQQASASMLGVAGAHVLFVNLHTMDLLDPDLFASEAALSGIASRVVLEITERSSLDRVSDLRTRVGQLREMGFRIAVDDLGAGYSGLNSFALLEPDIVKLDMSLVRNIHEDRTRQRLVRAMAALCREMGTLVVGEGVETAAERAALEELGCDLLQGRLIAPPDRLPDADE